MERNGTEILVWNMEDARMEWNGMEDFKNGIEDNLPYFHTNSILDFVHCIYRKEIPMSGSDKILSQKYPTSISAHTICRQIAVLCLGSLHCANSVLIASLQVHCNLIAALLLHLTTLIDLTSFLFFFFRLTICPVVNFVLLHRDENSYLLFHPRFA